MRNRPTRERMMDRTVGMARSECESGWRERATGLYMSTTYHSQTVQRPDQTPTGPDHADNMVWGKAISWDAKDVLL
jgi:hypothetical protein